MLYDLDALRLERKNISDNIATARGNFEKWVKGEDERLEMYDKEIAKAEAIIELHGEDPKKYGNPDKHNG